MKRLWKRVQGWLRTTRMVPDITLLGWPGRRFWHAHLRHRLLYGYADWLAFKKYAVDRHQKWIASGKPITLQRNYRGSLYVQGPKKERED
jgi:hypothetical protein